MKGVEPSVGSVLYGMAWGKFWVSAMLYMGVIVSQFGCPTLVGQIVRC